MTPTHAAVDGTASALEIEVNVAGVLNMGGAAVANYVSILEPLR